MKTGLLSVATLASAAIIAQANAGDYRADGGGFHGGAVAHAAPCFAALASQLRDELSNFSGLYPNEILLLNRVHTPRRPMFVSFS